MIPEEKLLTNWNLILEFSKKGCVDVRCSWCPFDVYSIGCLLINDSRLSETKTEKQLEEQVRIYCKDFVNKHLYGILESK